MKTRSGIYIQRAVIHPSCDVTIAIMTTKPIAQKIVEEEKVLSTVNSQGMAMTS